MRKNRTNRREFTPISIEQYVVLHLKSNPGTSKKDLIAQLQNAKNAKVEGARCACGGEIWALGSSQAGLACFTCITGEAVPDDDYEIV